MVCQSDAKSCEHNAEEHVSGGEVQSKAPGTDTPAPVSVEPLQVGQYTSLGVVLYRRDEDSKEINFYGAGGVAAKRTLVDDIWSMDDEDDSDDASTDLGKGVADAEEKELDEATWELLRHIPPHRVTLYRQVARCANTDPDNLYRAVIQESMPSLERYVLRWIKFKKWSDEAKRQSRMLALMQLPSKRDYEAARQAHVDFLCSRPPWDNDLAGFGDSIFVKGIFRRLLSDGLKSIADVLASPSPFSKTVAEDERLRKEVCAQVAEKIKIASARDYDDIMRIVRHSPCPHLLEEVMPALIQEFKMTKESLIETGDTERRIGFVQTMIQYAWEHGEENDRRDESQGEGSNGDETLGAMELYEAAMEIDMPTLIQALKQGQVLPAYAEEVKRRVAQKVERMITGEATDDADDTTLAWLTERLTKFSDLKYGEQKEVKAKVNFVGRIITASTGADILPEGIRRHGLQWLMSLAGQKGENEREVEYERGVMSIGFDALRGVLHDLNQEEQMRVLRLVLGYRENSIFMKGMLKDRHIEESYANLYRECAIVVRAAEGTEQGQLSLQKTPLSEEVKGFLDVGMRLISEKRGWYFYSAQRPPLPSTYKPVTEAMKIVAGIGETAQEQGTQAAKGMSEVMAERRRYIFEEVLQRFDEPFMYNTWKKANAVISLLVETAMHMDGDEQEGALVKTKNAIMRKLSAIKKEIEEE